MRWGAAVALVVVAYFVGAGATPVHAEDPPVVNTVTVNQGQTRTFTVSAPSDRVQCSTDYQEDKGSYCLQTRHGGTYSGNIAADKAPRYGACNGPFSLAPTTQQDGSTVTYPHTDEDGWIGWGGFHERNDHVEVRGRQMHIEGIGDPGTDYLTVALFGTQTVTLVNEGYGGPDTRTTYTSACSLDVRIRIHVRGPRGETSLQSAGLNDAFTQARTNARELTTTGRDEGDYVPPSTNRCRVIQFDNGGEMSWCGTYRDENNREVTPDRHMTPITELCRRADVTCHRR